MPVTKILARDYDFHLNTGTVGSPTWVEIKGIQTWTPSSVANDADTTTFDEDGWQSHLKASRSGTVTLDGLVLTDVSTGDRDPGQAAVEAWALEIGPDSIKQFRVTAPDTTTVVALASATVTKGAGSTDAAAGWQVNVTYSGSITDSSITAKPGAPTSVTGTALTDSASVTWTDTDPADGYEVTAYDDADDSVVAVINTDTKPAFFSGLTTGDDIYFTVRARNAAGLGQASAASTAVEIL